jgi:hypothetical protein
MGQTESDALVSDLDWQIEQLRARGIKDNAGRPYNPSHYKRGLESAIDRGGEAVVEYVRQYLYKPASGVFKKLEGADAPDLTCEALVADASKPYAALFTDEDRAAAQQRLGPYLEEIESRKIARAARMQAATERVRAKGLPRRSDLDASLRSRRN